MIENRRFIVDDAGTLIDIHTRECYDFVEEVVYLLNGQDNIIKQQKELISEQSIQLDYLKDENKHMKDVLNENKQLKELGDYQADKIKELQERNDRQYDILNHLWACIENNDWGTLIKERERMKEEDKGLQEQEDIPVRCIRIYYTGDSE